MYCYLLLHGYATAGDINAIKRAIKHEIETSQQELVEVMNNIMYKALLEHVDIYGKEKGWIRYIYADFMLSYIKLKEKKSSRQIE